MVLLLLQLRHVTAHFRIIKKKKIYECSLEFNGSKLKLQKKDLNKLKKSHSLVQFKRHLSFKTLHGAAAAHGSRHVANKHFPGHEDVLLQIGFAVGL